MHARIYIVVAQDVLDGEEIAAGLPHKGRRECAGKARMSRLSW